MRGQVASEPRGVLRALAQDSQLAERAPGQARCAGPSASAPASACSLLQLCDEKGGQGTRMKRRPRMDRVCRGLVAVCNDDNLQSALSDCDGDARASSSSNPNQAMRPMFIYSGTGCSNADQRRVHELYRAIFPSSYREMDVRSMLNSSERGIFATLCICSDTHGLLGAATTKLHQVNKNRAPRGSRSGSVGAAVAAAEIVYIAVQPEHRGRRIGANLITMTARLAQLLACSTLLVSAAHHAIPFWKRPELLQLRRMAPNDEQCPTLGAATGRKRRPGAESESESRRATAHKSSDTEDGTDVEIKTEADVEHDDLTEGDNNACASASFELLTAQLRAKHHGLESAVAGATLLSHRIKPRGQVEYVYGRGGRVTGGTKHRLPRVRDRATANHSKTSRRKRKPTTQKCVSRAHGEGISSLGLGIGIGQGGGGMLATLGCMPR